MDGVLVNSQDALEVFVLSEKQIDLETGRLLVEGDKDLWKGACSLRYPGEFSPLRHDITCNRRGRAVLIR